MTGIQPYPTVQLRRLARQASISSSPIKNTVAPDYQEDLYPGFSASGQDVWLTAGQATFEGPGVVVSAVGARCGKSFLAEGRWGVTANTAVLLPRPGVCAKYLWYLLNDEGFWIKGQTDQPYVQMAPSLATSVPCPTSANQSMIVKFLDRETAKIDALIAKQEQLIATLREDRAATITQAVTKGLNPNVEMKDSGVGWIGMTPTHWSVSQVRSFMRESDIRNTGAADQRYLSLVANVGVIPYEEKGDVGNKKPEDLSKCKIVRKDDFVINSMNYQIGSYGLSPHDGVCSPVYIVIRHNYDLVALRFALRIFQVGQFQKYAQSFGNGILDHRRSISWDTLKNLRTSLPPVDKQNAISSYLDEHCEKVDTLIAKSTEMIAALREYRSALITDAVTGKIDVRGVA